MELFLELSSKLFENIILSTSAFLSYNLALSKPLCPYYMQFNTSMVFWQSMLRAKLVFAIIALKRQIDLETTIITLIHFCT